MTMVARRHKNFSRNFSSSSEIKAAVSMLSDAVMRIDDDT